MTSSVSRVVACGIALLGAVVLCISFVSQASASVEGALIIRCDAVCDKGCKGRKSTDCSSLLGGCSRSKTDMCRPGEPCKGSYCKEDTAGPEDCWCYKY